MIRPLVALLITGTAILQDAPAGLIGLWKFDDTTGTTAHDSTLNNDAAWIPGTQSSPSWLPTGGLIGGAVDMPGDGSHRDYFTIPEFSSLNGTPAGMTISVWITPHNTSGYRGLVMTRGVADNVGGGATGQNYGLAREDAHGDGRISGAAVDSAANSIPPNAGWQHVVWVWDNAAGTQAIFINGVQSGPTQSSTDHPANLSISSNGDWRVGDDACCSSRLFNGLIDDLAVWDEALAPSAISTLYQNGLAGISAGEEPTPPPTLPLEVGVVINEVHYDPDPKTQFIETIELLNTNSTTVDVGGWSFAEGVNFSFPPGTVLDPLEYVLIAENPVALQARSFPNPATAPRIFQYTGSIDNDGESIELLDSAFTRIDRVNFRAEFPWPVSPNGEGDSMQLINGTLDNDLAGSWRGARPSLGAANWVSADNAPPQIRQVAHSPGIASSSSPTTVTAKITDPEGVASVNLIYQIVAPGAFIPAFLPLDYSTLTASPSTPLSPNPAFEDPANWTTIPMLDDGTGSDLLAGDDIYTATIAAQANRSLVRYRIATTDAAASPLSVRAPYPDDPSLNFAAFVYDGVPAWTADEASVHPDGPGHTYSAELLTSLPVFTMITRDSDRRQAFAYSTTGDGGWQIPASNIEARKTYNWECAFISDGIVYDHVGYRLRQRNDRYSGNGKRSIRYRFNRGHYFQARDEDGKKLSYKWSRLNTSKMSRFGGSTSYGIYETINSKLWRMTGVECPLFLPAHFRVIDGVDEAPSGTDGQHLGDFFGLTTIVEDIDGILLDNRKLPKGNMYKLKDGVYDGNEQRRYQSRTGVTDASDYDNVIDNLNPSQTEAWLLDHVDWDQWYKYHAIVEAVRHYDYGTPSTHLKNRAWYFQPAAGSPLGKLRLIPHDHDASWSKEYHDGLNDVGNSIGTGFPWHAAFGSITRPHTGPEKESITRGYRNYIRHFRDLLWQEETVETIIDSHIAKLSDFSLADRDRWVDSPAIAGSESMAPIEANAIVMKDMAFVSDIMYGSNLPGGRGAFLDQIAADPAIPDTPVISYSGPAEHTTGLLSFDSSPFSDPQGAGTFGAMEWRIAEVDPPAVPVVTLLPLGSTWSYLDDGSDQGTAWREPAFDDSLWASGPAKLGYGDSDIVTEVSYGPSSSNKFRTTYFRKSFDLTDAATLGDMTLSVYRDDGVVVYLNGSKVLSDNMPTSGVDYLSFASGNLSDDGAAPVTANLPNFLFVEGANTLAVEIHQRTASSSDISFDLSLKTDPPVAVDPIYEWNASWESGDLAGFQSTITAPAMATREGHRYRARVRHQDNSGRWSHWSAPYQFIAGAADAAIWQDSLVVSEVMYHPATPSYDEMLSGYDDDDFFEFIEIQNVGTQTLDLTNIRFTKGIDFNFFNSSITTLGPGEFALVVNHLAAFEMRYGAGLPVAGEYTDAKFDNGGENVKLSYGAGIPVQEFIYDDVAPWPVTPDGTGPSLVLNDPWSFPDHTDHASWRPSLYSSGSPGSADLTVFTGDPDADLDYDGLCALAEYGFGTSDLVTGSAPFQVAIQPNGDLTISFGKNLYAGDITSELQVSADLTTWHAAGPEYAVTESIDHGDGTATTTVTLAGPVTDERLFFRMHFTHVP